MAVAPWLAYGISLLPLGKHMPQSKSLDLEKTGSLQALAEAHFPRERGFTAAERKLLAMAPTGDVAVCGPSPDPKDPTNDPGKAESSEGNPGWGREREIGADLIRWLSVDHKAKEQVDPWGVYVQGAKVIGELNLDFAIVPFPIRLWRCALARNVSLVLAEIPQLDLDCTWTKSIRADGAVIKGDVYLRNGFRADGGVRFPGARIGGDLDCDGGSFSNAGSYALSAYQVEVRGSVFLRDEFAAQGEVSLLGAQIGGNLDCDGGTFNNPKGYALDVERAGVKGNVFLGDGFSAQGTVSLIDGHIDGSLDCRGAEFKEAMLDLRNTKANYLEDGRECWPQPGKLLLDGFVYGRIDFGPKDYETRLDWLARQPEKPFATQPYLQLAKVLREAGDNDGAVNVLEEMERRRRRQADQGRPDRQALSWLFGEFAGYGYDPARSVWAIAALSGLGWILYRRSYLMGGMVPTEKDASVDFKPDGQTPSRYERFAPLTYSVENSLPLVKLGQTEKWQPNPDPGASPQQGGKWIKSAVRAKPWPRRVQWLERLLVRVGLIAPVDLNEPPSRLSRFGTSPRLLR